MSQRSDRVGFYGDMIAVLAVPLILLVTLITFALTWHV